MSVDILIPTDGDTVSSPVTVTYSYEINNDAQFFTSVGPYRDTGNYIPLVPPAPNKGTTNSGPISVVVYENTEFTVSVSGADQGTSPDISVTVEASGDPAPVYAEAAPTERVGAAGPGAAHQTVRCTVPTGSSAAYVVCQVIEVFAGDRTTRVVIAAGAGAIAAAGNELSCTVDLEHPTQAGAYYVARAFAYDINQTFLGSFSVVLK